MLIITDGKVKEEVIAQEKRRWQQHNASEPLCGIKEFHSTTNMCGEDDNDTVASIDKIPPKISNKKVTRRNAPANFILI
jgi:hypothetical protein